MFCIENAIEVSIREQKFRCHCCSLPTLFNAVVTPLRKAASYEQRKTDLRKFPVTVTYYHVVPRITQH